MSTTTRHISYTNYLSYLQTSTYAHDEAGDNGGGGAIRNFSTIAYSRGEVSKAELNKI